MIAAGQTVYYVHNNGFNIDEITVTKSNQDDVNEFYNVAYFTTREYAESEAERQKSEYFHWMEKGLL